MHYSNPVTMLTLTAHLLGEERTIHPVLLQDGESAVLVDAGYPGQLPLLEQAIREAGSSLEQLTAVIVTHQDLDHIGGLPGLLQAAPNQLEILAHPFEQPFIEGRQTLLKLSGDALKGIDSWPEEMSAPFKRLIANPPRADVTGLLLGGETLPYGGGVTVIPTPGHTPGHLSLYHPASRTLIAADALLIEDGELQISSPALTWDMQAALQSVRELCRYEIETIICYHGGSYAGNAAARLKELAQLTVR
ncbi:MBL fold metallo-hydrolase [Paenibacillus aurantiacus]|uniref:MBL fold metallo-hydrolase n=1 Tax=Paenibacillus aurantiacus TaxID=1936118 RepID=A0ABV5KNJ2_9BACL